MWKTFSYNKTKNVKETTTNKNGEMLSTGQHNNPRRTDKQIHQKSHDKTKENITNHIQFPGSKQDIVRLKTVLTKFKLAETQMTTCLNDLHIPDHLEVQERHKSQNLVP